MSCFDQSNFPHGEAEYQLQSQEVESETHGLFYCGHFGIRTSQSRNIIMMIDFQLRSNGVDLKCSKLRPVEEFRKRNLPASVRNKDQLEEHYQHH